jgi:hypothetical protein
MHKECNCRGYRQAEESAEKSEWKVGSKVGQGESLMRLRLFRGMEWLSARIGGDKPCCLKRRRCEA